MGEKLMRERANSIVRDFVEKLYNLKEMFINSNTDAESIINETRKGIMNLENVEKRNKSAIKDCDYRLNRCEIVKKWLKKLLFLLRFVNLHRFFMKFLL